VPEGAVLGKTDMWSAGVVIYVILASQLLEVLKDDSVCFFPEKPY